MSRSLASLRILVALAASALASAACAEPSTEDTSAGSDAITASACADRIKDKVLDRARDISETASIVSTKTLYGSDQRNNLSLADAILVRVSDEVEPSDYIVVRSRLRSGVANQGTCTIKKTYVVAEGVLPGDDLIGGDIGAKCKESIQAAVLKKALARSDSSSIAGVKLLYGGDRTYGGAVLVRVSDEVEPTDYLAVFTLEGEEERRATTCKVKFTELLNEGVLPAISGL